MTSTLNEDFRDLLQAFADAEVRFLVVGAYALAVHGLPRATGDLDVWVEPSPDNAHRVYAALAQFGAPLHELTEADLVMPGTVFQIGVVPRRIDVLTELTGLDFGSAWKNRVTTHYAGVAFSVIGRNDLIINKRATGRARDLLDVDLLDRLPKE